MHKRARQAVVTAVAGVLLAGGATVAAKAFSPDQAPVALVPLPKPAPSAISAVSPASAVEAVAEAAAPVPVAKPAMTIKPIKPADAAAKPKSRFPAGTATATSFWDGQTASGKPMRYQTIASPYWPLGTKVKVTYRGKSATGVVEDFGPAEWAVAQHDIPAIVDLSEKMMADLTGTRSNTVHLRFEVLEWGRGRSYRHGGTGYGLAMGRE